MNVFVVGGGATGSVLINTLAKEKTIQSIRCLTRNKKIAEEFIQKNPKVKIFSGDINNKTEVEKLARASDLIINAASPWLNIPALKLAIRIGAHYQDLEAYLGLDDGKSRQPYAIEHLQFHNAFKRKKRLALFDSGAAPGLTNLLVASATDILGPLENAKIWMAEDIDASVVVSTWSPAAAVDEIYSRPVIYRNGKFIVLPRFSSPEKFKFPKPFGVKTTYPIMNNEAFTVPQYASVKNMEVRSAGSDDEVARIMLGLGLLEKKPIHIRGTTITPLEFIMKIMPPPPTPRELKHLIAKKIVRDGNFALFVRCSASRSRHKPKTLSFWIHFPSQRKLFERKIYSTYIAYPAGRCAAAFALEIPSITTYGTLPPEGLPKPNRERILKNIVRLGIKIKKR